MKKFSSNAGKDATKRCRSDIWRRLVSVFVCTALLCSNSGFAVLASAPENAALCGVEDHTHDESCFAQDTGTIEILDDGEGTIAGGNGIISGGGTASDGNGAVSGEGTGAADILGEEPEGGETGTMGGLKIETIVNMESETEEAAEDGAIAAEKEAAPGLGGEAVSREAGALIVSVESETADGEGNGAESGTEAGEKAAVTQEYAGRGYTVKVTYGAGGNLPGDAELRVDEYGKDSDQYKERYEKIAEWSGWGETDDRSGSIRIFEVGFYAGKEKIQPEPASRIEVEITCAMAEETDHKVVGIGSANGIEGGWESTEMQIKEIPADCKYSDGKEIIKFTADTAADFATIAGKGQEDPESELEEPGEESFETEMSGTEEESSETGLTETEEKSSETGLTETEEKSSETELTETEEESSETELTETEEKSSETEPTETGEETAEAGSSGTEEETAGTEQDGTEEEPFETESPETAEAFTETGLPETEEEMSETGLTELEEEMSETELTEAEEESTEEELTQEEQDQVDAVIALIDDLPDQEEIAWTLSAFEEDGDEEGYDIYLTGVMIKAREAYEAYDALTEKQKAYVTNADKLMELEWLWSAQTLDGQSGYLEADEAYISELGMGTTDKDTGGGITDGSAPFDENEGDGNDSSGTNRRVRTFDTVKYDFYYKTALQDANDISHYTSARVYFEFLLPVTREEAYFSVEEMAWMRTQNVDYRYEEVMKEVNGRTYQVLHGSFMDDREASDITAASQSRDVTVRVLNMENDSKIQPIFTMWLEPNQVGVENKGNIPSGIVYGSGAVCKVHGKNTVHLGQEYRTVVPAPVTVTCTPRYDITLKRGENATTSYAGDFDFSTGNEAALDKADENWNGRMNAFAIRLMVAGVDGAHGLRGCAFPKEGETIEFDIRLDASYQKSGETARRFITETFKPRVWSADAYLDGEKQQDGRILTGEKMPRYGAPLNTGKAGAADACKDGGTWTFTDRGLSADKQYRTVHVTVSGYTFDPTQLPSANYPASGGDEEFYNPAAVGSHYWNIQNAVFSTGEMWVVTPLYSQPGNAEQNFITKFANTESLTMWNSIGAYDMKLYDKNHTAKYEKSGELDKRDASITLQNPGNFNSFVALLKPLGAYNDPLTPGCYSGDNELKDYATPGSYADMEVIVNHDEATGGYAGVAYNVMAKFDNACFEPVTYAEMTEAGYKDENGMNDIDYPNVSHTWYPWPYYVQQGVEAKGPKMLYGTTKDKQGWNHGGIKPDKAGYDAEMMKAGPDDLVWYDSMEALKADGAVCVAVMMEYRNVDNDGTNSEGNSSMNHLHMVVHGKIREDVEPGYMYGITSYAAVWTKDDVEQLVTDASGGGTIDTWDYLSYTQNDFPSYSPSAANKMNSAAYPRPSLERSWYRCTYGTGEALNGANGFGTAQKSYLNENGNIISGSGGQYFLDCVYVVSYESRVGIQVAQTVTQSGTEVEKQVYTVDQGERVADFMVTPSAVRYSADAGTDGETTPQNADMTVQVTLPKGVEYYSGTAVWGGEYHQDDKAQLPGNVTGGTYMEPEIVVNEDGTSTLTWVLENIPLSKATENLAPIYFSGHIDPDGEVANNEELRVQADIWSTMDQGRLHGPVYNNQAATGITVSKSSALTIIKTADKAVVDSGDSMGFSMEIYNASESPYEGWIADILPKTGIGQSDYHGTLQVEEFRVIGVDPGWGTLDLYYTTEEQYSNCTNAQNLKSAENSGDWKRFHLTEVEDSDGPKAWSWAPPDTEKKPLTAIAYKGVIPAKGKITMHVTLKLPDGEPGDMIHNRLLLNDLSSSDRCQIVSRTLEGLVWMDSNANGIQDGEELPSGLLSGVKVTLMKLRDEGDPSKDSDYEPYHYQGDPSKPEVTIQTGEKVSVLSDGPGTSQGENIGENSEISEYQPGRYKFTGLPAGVYAVKFEDGSGTKISSLIASPVGQAQDDIDSDGEPHYNDTDRSILDYTIIKGIKLPVVEDIHGPQYESKHHDSGFYQKGHELPLTGGSGTFPYTFSGIALMAGALMYYISRRRRGIIL